MLSRASEQEMNLIERVLKSRKKVRQKEYLVSRKGWGPKMTVGYQKLTLKVLIRLYRLSLSQSIQDERTNGTEVLGQFSFSSE